MDNRILRKVVDMARKASELQETIESLMEDISPRKGICRILSFDGEMVGDAFLDTEDVEDREYVSYVVQWEDGERTTVSLDELVWITDTLAQVA